MTHYKWKRIALESLGPLLLALAFSMISGTFLNHALDLKHLTSILLVVPAFVNIAGDIGAVASARISTALYLGDMSKVSATIAGSIIVATLLFGLLGISAEMVLSAIGAGIGIVRYLEITLIAGVSATCIILGLAISLEFMGFKLGMDPSDLAIPLLSNLGDAIGVGLLILTASTIMGV